MRINEKELLKVVGKNIKKARLYLGVTQRTLAQVARISPAYICEMEKGKENISLVYLYKICWALGKQPSEILPSIHAN